MTGTPNNVITLQTIATAQAVATAAKTTYSDTTNAVLLLTFGANGGALYSLKALPRATVTASQLQLYRSLDGGVTLSLIDLKAMAAYAMAATTDVAKTDFGYSETNPLRGAPLEKLYIASGVALAGGIVFDAQYENA